MGCKITGQGFISRAAPANENFLGLASDLSR
jgi:hypothetical protein